MPNLAFAVKKFKIIKKMVNISNIFARPLTSLCFAVKHKYIKKFDIKKFFKN